MKVVIAGHRIKRFLQQPMRINTPVANFDGRARLTPTRLAKEPSQLRLQPTEHCDDLVRQRSLRRVDNELITGQLGAETVGVDFGQEPGCGPGARGVR